MTSLLSRVLSFEELICQNHFDEAQEKFHELLSILYEQKGQDLAVLFGLDNDDQIHMLIERICNAVGYFTCNKNTHLNLASLDQLIRYQYVLSRLFLNSRHRNADHFLQLLMQQHVEGVIDSNLALKYFLLLSTETQLASFYDVFKLTNKDLFFCGCLMMVWAHSATYQSDLNREWAYQKIAEMEDEKDLSYPLDVIHGYFMHSSYGFAENKHLLKKIINVSLAKKLNDKYGHLIIKPAKVVKPSGKPIMLVVLEYYNLQHSVYRVLGKSLAACRNHFKIIAVAMPGMFADNVKNEFDISITLTGVGEDCCVSELINIVNQHQPDIIYYPSIGMTPWTIQFSNLRLAPVQVNSVGHAASSYAKEIDYFLIEEDIAGQQRCYSEKLVKLPTGAMPFLPPTQVEYKPKSKPLNAPLVRVACTLSSMKLNYAFLSCCAEIAERCIQYDKRVEFTIFIGNSESSISDMHYKNLITEMLPNSTLFHRLSFNLYLEHLAERDVSLSPFPYGNMNSLIDAARLGIPGVCMHGDEPHEAIDAGMWRRIESDSCLIADDVESYINAAVRLIVDENLRHQISKKLIEQQSWQKMFIDNSDLFSEQMLKLVKQG